MFSCTPLLPPRLCLSRVSTCTVSSGDCESLTSSAENFLALESFRTTRSFDLTKCQMYLPRSRESRYPPVVTIGRGIRIRINSRGTHDIPYLLVGFSGLLERQKRHRKCNGGLESGMLNLCTRLRCSKSTTNYSCFDHLDSSSPTSVSHSSKST